MKKYIHAIFPQNYKNRLFEGFGKYQEFELKDFDSDFSNYYSYILNENTKDFCDTVFAGIYDYKHIPFVQQIKDIVEMAIEVKLSRPTIRLVLIFPTIVEIEQEYQEFIQKLIMAGIYDLHFVENFGFKDIISFLENKMTVSDVRRYITNGEIHIFDTKTEIESDTITQNVLTAYKDSDSIENSNNHNQINVNDPKEIISEEVSAVSPKEGELDDNSPVPEPKSIKVIKDKGFFNFKKTSKSEQESEVDTNKKTPIESKKVKKPARTRDEQEILIQTIADTKSRMTKKMAVIGLTRGVGTTFVTTNFASFLSASGIETGVYENPIFEPHRTYMADIFLMFDEEVANPSLPHCIINETEFDKKKAYKIKKTNYYPVNYFTNPIMEFDTHEWIRYVNTGHHNVKLIDMGYLNEKDLINKTLINKLCTFDSVLIVLSPLPTRLIPNAQLLLKLTGELSQLGVDYHTVLNQFEGEISKSEFKLYNLHKSLDIPNLNSSTVTKAMYKHSTAYDYDRDCVTILKPPFLKIAKALNLPIEAKAVERKNSLLDLVR